MENTFTDNFPQTMGSSIFGSYHVEVQRHVLFSSSRGEVIGPNSWMGRRKWEFRKSLPTNPCQNLTRVVRRGLGKHFLLALFSRCQTFYVTTPIKIGHEIRKVISYIPNPLNASGARLPETLDRDMWQLPSSRPWWNTVHNKTTLSELNQTNTSNEKTGPIFQNKNAMEGPRVNECVCKRIYPFEQA
jgi:hypothetical protein